MNPDEVGALIGYPWYYLTAGILALLAAGILAVLFSPRRAERAARRSERGPGEPLFANTFGSELAALRERYFAGELDLAALHLAAADIARRFGSNQLGENLANHTLNQLQAREDAHEIADVITVVEIAERPSFDLDVHVMAERTFTALSEMIGRPR